MEVETLASLLLPEGMLDHFEVKRITECCDTKTRKNEYHIWIDELNLCPEGYESKGFYNEKVIQDFPVRGKALYLHVRRRRWRDIDNIRPDIKSNFSFIAKGVKLTEELASFLKG